MTENLRITEVSFFHFRNYENLSLDKLGSLTIFTGPNAVGKTNILEGIQLLTSSQSFRHPQVSQLIREGESSARIAMNVSDGNRQITTALALQPGKKNFTVNGKRKQAADVRGLLPSVMFTPDDLQIAKKSSSVKRDAIDALGMQLNRNYYIVKRDYDKVLRYKNRLLKEEASRMLIDSINETMVTCAAQLHCLRRALFDRIVPHVVGNYASIAHDREQFSAIYQASWEQQSEKAPQSPALTVGEARNLLQRELERVEEEERTRHKAVMGPHNDHIRFMLANRDASSFASQGQQRSIVLAWKLAEVAVTREVLQVNPVLLLDDVLSELDESRRSMLVGFMTEDVQTFITATGLEGFRGELLERASVIRLPFAR